MKPNEFDQAAIFNSFSPDVPRDLKSFLPPHDCLMIGIQLNCTPLLLEPIVHRRCHYSAMLWYFVVAVGVSSDVVHDGSRCCRYWSTYKLLLSESLQLCITKSLLVVLWWEQQLQYLKSHDALAGGCRFSST